MMNFPFTSSLLHLRALFLGLLLLGSFSPAMAEDSQNQNPPDNQQNDQPPPPPGNDQPPPPPSNDQPPPPPGNDQPPPPSNDQPPPPSNDQPPPPPSNDQNPPPPNNDQPPPPSNDQPPPPPGNDQPAPPAKHVKQPDPAAEAEIDKRFNANPNTRGLRNIVYTYIPDFIKHCPSWESQMKDWHRCEAVVPFTAVVNFRNKLRKEPLNTRIQQWFFLDAIGGIERPDDDMVRAKSFLSKYFAKIILHELHDDNAWCYGPSWVGHSQKAWMPCANIPDFASRSLPQWALYTPPKDHPRPTWPGTFDDTAPDEPGPMEVPAKVIEEAAKPDPQAANNGNLTKSYKGEDNYIPSLQGMPTHKLAKPAENGATPTTAESAPAQNSLSLPSNIDPSILLSRAEQIVQSPEGAGLLQQILSGDLATRQKAVFQASKLLKMSPLEIAQTAQALKSSPQGMLILQQIKQLDGASPEEKKQTLMQIAGMLGVSPEKANEIAQQAQQAAHGDTNSAQQLLDQAKNVAANAQPEAEKAPAADNSDNMEAGKQALARAAALAKSQQEDNNLPPAPAGDQPATETTHPSEDADRGVFDIDKHDPNHTESNAGGERDLLSYDHPDNSRAGLEEGSYGNSEDRNSKGSQYVRSSPEYSNFEGAGKPVNNPADDGVAQDSGSVDMSNMSSMPSNLPTPAQGSENAPAPSAPPAVPDGNGSASWQNQSFDGSANPNPYGNANFAPQTQATGENSPPPAPAETPEPAQQAPQQPNPAPAAPVSPAAPPEPAKANPSGQKWKIVKEGETASEEEDDWKVVKQ